MKPNRRATLVGATALPFAPSVRAQDFPTKPIKIVVPFAAGSATDTTARGLGAKLQEWSAARALVDDKPGADWVEACSSGRSSSSSPADWAWRTR